VWCLWSGVSVGCVGGVLFGVCAVVCCVCEVRCVSLVWCVVCVVSCGV
jgi:hypothetical protein